MNDQGNRETSVADQRLEALYVRAIPRMLRIMLVASLVFVAPAFWLSLIHI